MLMLARQAPLVLLLVHQAPLVLLQARQVPLVLLLARQAPLVPLLARQVPPVLLLVRQAPLVLLLARQVPLVLLLVRQAPLVLVTPGQVVLVPRPVLPTGLYSPHIRSYMPLHSRPTVRSGHSAQIPPRQPRAAWLRSAHPPLTGSLHLHHRLRLPTLPACRVGRQHCYFPPYPLPPPNPTPQPSQVPLSVPAQLPLPAPALPLPAPLPPESCSLRAPRAPIDLTGSPDQVAALLHLAACSRHSN